ncbi:hypothetical protein TRAPUB_4298, partial [Trametes pubescens]
QFNPIIDHGDGTRVERVKYECKTCETRPFNSKGDARKHAILKRHRNHFLPTVPEPAERTASPPARYNGSAADAEDGAHCEYDASAAPEYVTAGPDMRLPASTAISDDGLDEDTDNFADPEFSPDSYGYISPPEDLPHSDSEDSDASYSGFGDDEEASSDSSDTCPEWDMGADSDDTAGPRAGAGRPDSARSGTQGSRRRRGHWPYPNLTWCILDIVLNLPRHPISDELLKILLWALKMLGVKDVPSIKAFRKFQTQLRGTSLFKKELARTSVLGNQFASNSILKSIALVTTSLPSVARTVPSHATSTHTVNLQDMGNPEVRRYLKVYPEEPVNGSSELRHSQKWFIGLPDDKLTPMWALRGLHFYVGEVAELANGEVVIPLRWFVRLGEMYMFYYRTRCIEVMAFP